MTSVKKKELIEPKWKATQKLEDEEKDNELKTVADMNTHEFLFTCCSKWISAFVLHGQVILPKLWSWSKVAFAFIFCNINVLFATRLLFWLDSQTDSKTLHTVRVVLFLSSSLIVWLDIATSPVNLVLHTVLLLSLLVNSLQSSE